MAIYQQRRPKSAKARQRARAYSGTWARVSRRYRRRHPMCEHGCGRISEMVDHVTPLIAGGARLDPANLQALCCRCHAIKTAEDMKIYPEYHDAS